MTEFDLISRYFTRPEHPFPADILGPGDDCALLRPSNDKQLAITTDTLTQGTHFFADCDPRDLGWKALAVSLSDLAAMGATPCYAQVALCMPEANESWVAAFSDGLFACADNYSVLLTGGDLTQGPLNASITAIGELEYGRALLRNGAHAGDDIWVSGVPGLAALGLAHLRSELTLPARAIPDCLAALHHPQPRIALGQALLGVASAAIDVSDGLLSDLRHVLTASRLAAQIQLAQLPELAYYYAVESSNETLARHCQLAGGDDYELCFCVVATRRVSIIKLEKQLGLPLTRIGRTLAGKAGQIQLLDAEGNEARLVASGYEHFTS